MGTFRRPLHRPGIARSHRAPTVGCMLLVPVLLSALRFSPFGATALSLHIDAGHAAVVEAVGDGRLEMAIFGLLEALPLGAVTPGIAIVLVASSSSTPPIPARL